jgi:SAM-dependent methyltransferase
LTEFGPKVKAAFGAWRAEEGRLRESMVEEIYPEAQKGIDGPLEEWLRLNSAPLTVEVRPLLAPFPPQALMRNTTGLQRDEDFAAHGVHIAQALASASPTPLADFNAFLDFGVGVGRLARLFKGFEGRYVGADIDADNIAWVSRNYTHVEAVLTKAGAPLPFEPRQFDGASAISVFSHLTEANHLFYLEELRRVTRPHATVFITVHGERALQRAEVEAPIFALLEISDVSLRQVRADFASGAGYSFILQNGHLTSAPKNRDVKGWRRLWRRRRAARGEETVFYEYGITFIDAAYITHNWSRYFDVINILPGAIHDFQDLIVLRRRDD